MSEQSSPAFGSRVRSLASQDAGAAPDADPAPEALDEGGFGGGVDEEPEADVSRETPKAEAEEPEAPSPLDASALIEQQQRQIESLTSLVARASEPRPEPTKTLEESIGKAGFGRVQVGVDAEGNPLVSNWTPNMKEIVDLAVREALAKVAPDLNELKNKSIVESYHSSLVSNGVKNVADQDFVRFQRAELENSPAINSMPPREAGELIAGRWRKHLNRVKLGEERRLTRATGGALQDAAPRGSNSSRPTLDLSKSNLRGFELTKALIDFADKGGDPRDVTMPKARRR